MKFRTILIILLLILIAGGIAGYIIFPRFIETKISDFTSGKELFSLPLVGKFDANNTLLTLPGVITETNNRRIAEHLTALTENAKLDAAAAVKLKDMFARQYFEHISPDGHGPGYLADQAGYAYIIVGENLAEGNFKNDTKLVDAWMASPGHRANILNSRFADIGVAVGKGTMNGKEVWLAVQEFGTPISNCPAISNSLKVQTDSEKSHAESLAITLNSYKHQLETMPQGTQSERAAYNKTVDEYNALVNQYTELAAKLKSDVDRYNTQVRAFNNCLNESTPAAVHE